MLLLHLSNLNRPIKWLEDRAENFIGTTAESVQMHDCEIAFNKDGKVLGFKDVFLYDTGALIHILPPSH